MTVSQNIPVQHITDDCMEFFKFFLYPFMIFGENAIMEEITNAFDKDGSVDIMTDSRHRLQKVPTHAKVVCLGQTIHKC